MTVTWAYGITTVASRIASGLLERTILSLAKGGFDNPRLFIDGLPIEALPDFAKDRQVTIRNPAIRLYGNFHLGLSELYIREPHADRYAMFQDDMVTYPNLRQYLESCEYPKRGYLNLYTFRENEKSDRQGWYLSNQLGKGAVALVFNNETLVKLLKNGFWLTRHAIKHTNAARSWKFVDGGVVEAMRQQGCKEFVHYPSLVQHTGTMSTLGNSRHAQAPSFKGESFDALRLVVNSPVLPNHRGPRIGMVGTNTKHDHLNRRIAENADIYRWLIKPHPMLGVADVPQGVDYVLCPQGHKVGEFLDQVDIVVYLETPCFANLADLCQAKGKKIVCVSKADAETDDWSKFDDTVRSITS